MTLDESWPAEDSAALPPDGVVIAVVARIICPSDAAAAETAVIFDSVPLLMFGATTADATVTIVDLGETVAAVGAALGATNETAEMVLATVCLCGGVDGLSIGV